VLVLRGSAVRPAGDLVQCEVTREAAPSPRSAALINNEIAGFTLPLNCVPRGVPKPLVFATDSQDSPRALYS